MSRKPSITIESGDTRIPMKTWQDEQGVVHMSIDWANVAPGDVLIAKRTEIYFTRLTDDDGNPAPLVLQGDMIPMWYKGQWWVDWSAYVNACLKNGDLP